MIPDCEWNLHVSRPGIGEHNRQRRYLPRGGPVRSMAGYLVVCPLRGHEVLWREPGLLAQARGNNAIRFDQPVRAGDRAHPAGR